ncbi:MAG: lysophospholipid acyltransferase family protein [Pseudomonadota bacterium]|nr:lysophospholipid acyltransferase family protein [Pseudomonadota bacterium]
MSPYRYDRIFTKISVVAILVACHFICVFVVRLACLSNLTRRRKIVIKLNRFWGDLLLKVIGFRIKREGVIPAGKSYFFVANHLSYIDPLIMFASIPAIFITSKEIGEDMLLGTICRMGECYFVERRNKFNIMNEIKDVGEYIKAGFNVAIFPEGRSTDGDRVWRFKSSFFQVALNEQADVLPICLQYTTISNAKITPDNRDLVFWYDGRPFLAHFAKMLSQSEISVRVKVLAEIPQAGHDKNSLAAAARSTIVDTYEGVQHS